MPSWPCPKTCWRPGTPQVNDFRDPFLVTLAAPVAVIDVRGQDSFSLQQQTNGTWRVLPQDFPADAGLVKDLLSALSALQIVEFTKDVVIAPDLPAYGLASPARQYILRSAATNSPAGRNQCDHCRAGLRDEPGRQGLRAARG